MYEFTWEVYGKNVNGQTPYLGTVTTTGNRPDRGDAMQEAKRVYPSAEIVSMLPQDYPL